MMSVRFAQRLFLAAGIYGIAVVAPLFFLEKTLGEQYPPALTHVEFFYGFAWVALAWQFAFLVMSRDPLRYRLLILPALVEKLGFGCTALVLFAQGRLAAANVVLPVFDLVLAGLFAWAFVALGQRTQTQTGRS
jgi:hypothetical protein